MLALTSSVCLHVICQIGYKVPSINNPHRRPPRPTLRGDWPDIQWSGSPDCQSNPGLPNLWRLMKPTTRKCRRGGAGRGGLGYEESSFAFLPTCHVKPRLTKWTLSSPDVAAADLARSVSRAHLPTCPSTATAGCHSALVRSGRWRWGWGVGGGTTFPLYILK